MENAELRRKRVRDFYPLPASKSAKLGPTRSCRSSILTAAGGLPLGLSRPKDDTPGCTTEGIAFSALRKKFDAAKTVVLGVSKDSIEKHCKFRDKHNLTVRLLSDEDGKMLEAYGVWGEKSLYGRKFMGITRTTFLIDEKGVVRKVWPKVKVNGHADEVLVAAKEL